MKKVIFITAFVIALSGLALYYYAGNIARAVIKARIQALCPGSVVSIGRCGINPARWIDISDLKIKAGAAYDIRIKHINIAFSPLGMLRGGALRQNSIKSIDLKFDSLGARGVLLENGYLSGKPSEEGAKFYIRDIKYNDVKINEVSGNILLRDNTVFLKSFEAKLFDGTVSGETSYRVDKNRDFIIELKADSVNLGAFTREMKMENKFRMTGQLNGKAVLSGNGLAPRQIDGNFTTDPSGGVLIIKDTGFLENMAKNSGQSLDILMESFKEYRYNMGLIKLSADGDNLKLDIALEGDSGKRNFSVVLHDFLSKKGWGL